MELKPCKKCKKLPRLVRKQGPGQSSSQIYYDLRHYCENESLWVETKTEQEAIEAWNTRQESYGE